MAHHAHDSRPGADETSQSSDDQEKNAARLRKLTEGDVWARRLKKGDPEALSYLMDLYKQAVFFLAWRVTRNEADALDITQDTFIKVMNRISTWQEQSAFSTWLYSVTLNLARDCHRHRNRQQQLKQRLAGLPPPPATDSSATVAADNAEEIDRRKQAVREAMARLPEKQRQIMILRHYQGLPLQEISRIQGCALGTVKATLFQAVRNLQKYLGFSSSSSSSQPGEAYGT